MHIRLLGEGGGNINIFIYIYGGNMYHMWKCFCCFVPKKNEHVHINLFLSRHSVCRRSMMWVCVCVLLTWHIFNPAYNLHVVRIYNMYMMPAWTLVKNIQIAIRRVRRRHKWCLQGQHYFAFLYIAIRNKLRPSPAQHSFIPEHNRMCHQDTCIVLCRQRKTNPQPLPHWAEKYP